MKRSIALLSIASLILTIPSIAIGATPVAGAKCIKLGQTQISANKKFTCIKSGKNLSWSKGVLQVAPKPTPIATPAPISTPIPTPTSSTALGSRFFFGDPIRAASSVSVGSIFTIDLPITSNYDLTTNIGYLDKSGASGIQTNGKLISGDKKAGIWRYEFDIPANQTLGSYSLLIEVSDSNNRNYRTELGNIEINRSMKILMSAADLNDYKTIAKKSFDQVRSKFSSNELKNITLKIYTSNTFPKQFVKPWNNYAEIAAKYYDQLIDTPQEFRTYFVTEQDTAYMQNLGLWKEPGSGLTLDGKNWLQDNTTDSCEASAAGYFFDTDAQKLVLHGGVAVPSKVIFGNRGNELGCAQTIIHEMFHAVQDYWQYSKKSGHAWATQDDRDRVLMPIFREGSDNSVTRAVFTDNFDDYLLILKQANIVYFNTDAPKLADIFTEADVIKTFKLIEKQSSDAQSLKLAYPFGQLLFEKLIADYGIDKYFELLKTHNDNFAFKDSFQRVYGFSLDTAYSLAARHVLLGINYAKS